MSAFDSREGRRNAIFLIIVALIIILLLSFVVGGVEGIFGIIKFFITALMVVAFFGFIFYIIYFIFFKKHRRDIPYENWKEYLRSALENGADMMGDLILTGDKEHSSKNFMTIKGYLRILAFDNNEYDMFVGKRNPLNPIEEYKIVMLKPEQHSDLIGDVYVKGISLIKKYGYYFLNTELLNFKAIDEHVTKDTYRTLMYETLGDMKQIMDRATGLDPEYRKEQLREKLLKIPILAGQQQKNSGEQK